MRTDFRQAVAERWRGAVFDLAEKLADASEEAKTAPRPANPVSHVRPLRKHGPFQEKLLRVATGEKLDGVLTPDERDRVINRATDVAFRLTYDSAYAAAHGITPSLPE